MVLVYLTNGQVASLASATKAATRFYTDQEMSSSSTHDAIAFLDSGGEEVGRFRMVDAIGWAIELELEKKSMTGDVLDYVLDNPRWLAVAESELTDPPRWWVTDIQHILDSPSALKRP